jgi:hypothetical protein
VKTPPAARKPYWITLLVAASVVCGIAGCAKPVDQALLDAPVKAVANQRLLVDTPQGSGGCARS